MKKTLLLVLLLSIFSQNEIYAQTVFWSEDFETDGTGTRYTAADQFIDDTLGSGGSEDFFGRIQNTGTQLRYAGCADAQVDFTFPVSGQSGSYFMAGEDLNDGPNSTPRHCGSQNTASGSRTVEFLAANGHDINITGASTMTFKILVAVGTDTNCNVTNARWDAGEGLKVYYTKDGGTEMTALCFAPDISCGTPSTTNEPLKTDPNCDGNGTDGVIVPNVFTEYSFTIPAGGNSLEVRVEITANAADEEIAFDNLRLEAVTTPLPVKMSMLNLLQQGENVALKWSTYSETNSSYFAIERSRDGIAFSEIGTIPGAGNSYETIDYSFLDTNPYQGFNYYRVRQVDIDGQYAYGSLASTEVNKSNIDFDIIPNPSMDKITVEGLTAGTKYVILDCTGRKVQSGVLDLEEVTISSLPKGVYLIQVEVNGKLSTKKLMKK